MSDNDSDVTAELKELIADYKQETQPKADQIKHESVDVKPKPKSSLKKRRPKPKLDLNIEVPMDKVLFGDKKGLLQNLAKAVGDNDTLEGDKADSTDAGGDGAAHIAKKRKAVWEDADDVEVEVGDIRRETKRTGPLDHLRKDKAYNEYLRRRFERINAQPKWASLDRKVADDDIDTDDEELLHSVGFLEKPSVGALPPKDLSYKRLKDLNRASYAEGVITSVEFHPTSTAALVAGNKGVATIYAVDGIKNEKLHSIHFKDFNIRCARIKPCGTKAFFGDYKYFLYTYDLLSAQETRVKLPYGIDACDNFEFSPCGRFMAVVGRSGALHLFDAKSVELIRTFQQQEYVGRMRFTADSRRLITTSRSSCVNIFSIREQRQEHSFFDDGCIVGNALDLSPNQRMLATGSKEGVVNVYDFERAMSTTTPLPEKHFLNLTTPIANVRFNHSSELLGMCSLEVPTALKLAHFPSASVYANFPLTRKPLGHIRNITFSPNSGYMALGTKDDAVVLYRLKHFQNY